MRIFRLRYRGHEHIETTRVDPLSSQATKIAVHSLRTAPAKLSYRFDSQRLEIFEHRWAN
jgi:hypothetical protein